MRAILVAVITFFAIGIATSGMAEDSKTTESTAATKTTHVAGTFRTLNDYFPFTAPKSVEEWERRKADVQRNLMVALGLWPMPERAELKPVIHGKVERDDFTVERVFFECYPGLYVTGSLFRPKPTQRDENTADTTANTADAKRVGVLCPHGHWQNGRFYAADAKETLWDITKGAERYENEGRYPVQSRCVQLARMGCVVFQYDMIGVADSIQLGHQLGYRSEMAAPDRWGLFSPQAELRSINEMGMQTLHSIAALDFLASLSDVDPTKLAVTGCSGGGTQTFILCAIDPRPAVAFPAVMVSTAMQGGCVCENACYLRNHMGNVEFAACFAPKPLGLTAADDWTVEMETKGFPELQSLYALYGAEERTQLFPFTHFPHNYNQTARACMYRWMNRFFQLGYEEPILERPFTPLTPDELTVWTDADGAYPAPSGDQIGETFELHLVRQIDESQRRAIDSLSEPERRRIIGGAYQAIVGNSPSPAEITEITEIPAHSTDPTSEEGGRTVTLEYPAPEFQTTSLRRATFQLYILQPVTDGSQPQRIVVIGSDQSIPDDPEVSVAVLRADLGDISLWTHPDHPELVKWVPDDYPSQNWGASLAYTYGYNDPPIVQAAREILAVAAWLRREYPEATIELNAGPTIVAQAALAWVVDVTEDHETTPMRFDHGDFETGGFRFEQIRSFQDPRMLPGAVKFGDIPAMLFHAHST